LNRALSALEGRGVGTADRSGLYQSAPVGIPSPRPFLNGVIRATWEGGTRELLEVLLEVEQVCGRRRDHPTGDRTCDLDLLLFHDRVQAEADPVLPHPRIAQRRFVLLPLLELEPGAVDPTTGLPYADALPHTADQPCEPFCGPDGWG